MKKTFNFFATIRRVEPDRIVVRARNGIAHIMMDDNIGMEQRQELRNRIGTNKSIWVCKNGDGPLTLLPTAERMPVTPPRDYGRRRRA